MVTTILGYHLLSIKNIPDLFSIYPVFHQTTIKKSAIQVNIYISIQLNVVIVLSWLYLIHIFNLASKIFCSCLVEVQIFFDSYISFTYAHVKYYLGLILSVLKFNIIPTQIDHMCCSLFKRSVTYLDEKTKKIPNLILMLLLYIYLISYNTCFYKSNLCGITTLQYLLHWIMVGRKLIPLSDYL